MSTKTTNLEMTLLAEEDNFDTNVYNENFQKTDDKIGELNSMLGSEELTTTSQTHSGAINELNKNSKLFEFGDMVDLTVYTDNSPYTAPCDGLMKVSISPVTNAYAYGYINRVRVSSVSNITTASMAGYSCVTIPIRKGMKLYGHTSSISDGYEVVQFIPYK